MEKFLSIPLILASSIAMAAPIESKCYESKDFYKTVEDNPMITLYSSKAKDGSVEEVMVGLDRKAYTVHFQLGTDGDATKAKQYCVSDVTTDVVFNDKAIELLHKLLEKTQGDKA
jgi:hypothetical protein